MSIVDGYRFESMVGDPDDHRPDTSWALLVDPGDDAGRVDDLAVISERIAAGDRIPLHVHRVNEVILAHGPGRFTLGDNVRSVDDGAVIFIPAGVPHGFHNDGDVHLPVQAVFPTTRVWLRYLERNPAPGYEDRPAQPGATYDLRTGDVEFDPS
jgi:quercetin dioxygenase-like cupin family protein